MEITVELIVAYIMVIALLLYALSAGADFGGGIWDLFAFGKNARKERDAISKAIGPIWEANHVWLIFVLVILLGAFPKAFSVIMTNLFLPMFLILIGIVMRGAAFVFKKYDPDDKHEKFWVPVFGLSSFLAPFLLGLCLGAVAGENIQVDLAQVDLFSAWLQPFPIVCGLFSQGLFAYLAAVYLCADTKSDKQLAKIFKRKAIISGLMLAPVSALVYFVARDGAPYLFTNLNSFWAPALLLLTSIFAIGALVYLFLERYEEARIMAACQVGSIIMGWALAQYPYLVVGKLSIFDSAASDTTLWFIIAVSLLGSVILLPSLAYLFYIFKAKK